MLLMELLRDAESAGSLPGLQFERAPASSLRVRIKGPNGGDAISRKPFVDFGAAVVCPFIMLQAATFLFSAVVHVTQHRLISG